MQTHISNVFVFVSYSSIDEKSAKSLADKLEAARIQFFLDRKTIDLGDNFKAKITEGIQRCTDVVLIASPSSLKSPWVFYEIGQAVALRRRVLTYLTHPCLDLPSFLSDFQFAKSPKEIVDYFKHRAAMATRPTGLTIRVDAQPDSPTLQLMPQPSMARFLGRFPPAWFHGHASVDGAVELHTFPDHGNQFGGITREQCHLISTDVEWSDLATAQLSRERLAILGQELRSWIGTRRAKPNRIRFLIEPPSQKVLDNNEFQLKVGNSDYFTMRTVTSFSISSRDSDGDRLIADVFDEFWGEVRKPFRATTVPYHISAHGVLFNTDPATGTQSLIMTLPSRQRAPLVPGWNASFAEQMWAPSPTSQRPSWWSAFVQGLTIESPKDRTGDQDLWATVFRGLQEELGIRQADLSSEPKLIASCIEQDMYFLAFIFVLHTSLTPADLQKRRLGATDKEIGPIAAFPIEGELPDGTVLDPLDQFSKLLASDEFDGGAYLLPTPISSLVDGWHLSSRLRIYAAARHMLGSRVLDRISPV